MDRIRKYKRDVHVIDCTTGDNEIKTRQGLAYTPADMDKLLKQGMPVNSANVVDMFNDGSENPTFHITSDKVRDVDVAELWEEHEVLKEKARSAAKQSKSS